jgi:hypothetical protein
MAETVVVRLDETARPEEVEGVAAAFREAGVDATVEATWEFPGRQAVQEKAAGLRRPSPEGNGIAYWIVETAVPYVLEGMFQGVLGVGGWVLVKGLVDRLRDTRRGAERGKEGIVSFTDPDGTTVQFLVGEEPRTEPLPDDAYRALFDIDWSKHKGDVLVWDWRRERWESKPDVINPPD